MRTLVTNHITVGYLALDYPVEGLGTSWDLHNHIKQAMHPRQDLVDSVYAYIRQKLAEEKELGNKTLPIARDTVTI